MLLVWLGTEDVTIQPISGADAVTLSTNEIISVEDRQGQSLKDEFGVSKFKEVNDISAYFDVIIP